jgi:hypothetical protein
MAGSDPGGHGFPGRARPVTYLMPPTSVVPES